MAATDGIGRQIIIAGLGVLNPDIGDRLVYGEKLLSIWQSRPGGDELVRQASRAEKSISKALANSFEDYERMPENERIAASKAVERVLSQSRLTKERLVEISFNAKILWEEIEDSRREVLAEAALSDHAYSFALILLRESCEYLVSFVRHLPEVRDQATLDTFVRTHHMEQSLQLVIDDMRSRQDQDQTRQDRFLIDFRRGLLTQYGYLQLFGLSVAPEYRRQRIDIAYVTLSVTLTDKQHGPLAEELEAHGYRALGRNLIQREGLTVDAAITSLATYRAAARARGGGPVGFTPQHLTTGLRILLVGAAGSGKSTVSQWLAVLLAKQDARKTPSAIRGNFPFLIKLRELLRRDATEFIDKDLIRVQGVDAGDASDAWLEDTLRSGNALLIFDGLDELSGVDREAALLWMESLMDRYPKCSFMVTSRPDDVDRGRFFERHFSLFDLSPMEWSTTVQCIDNWFDAMAGIISPEEQGAKQLLLGALKEDPSLRQLAETPLIASMLCAIYAHDQGGSTSTRTELYERVSDVLLHRRDQYRKSVTQQWENLRLRDKRLILSEIAHQMQEASSAVLALSPSDLRYLGIQSEASPQSRTKCLWDVLDEVLPEMPGVNAASEEMADFLLSRSVLLTRITRHECQFLHRSFQEYFSALWYTESLNALEVDTLLLTDSGRSVLSFVSGAIGRNGAGKLLDSLCDAHERAEPRLKRASAVLVAECFSSVVSVAAETYQRALDVTETVVPPRSPTEARDLARHGTMALQWVNTWLDRNPEADGVDGQSLIFLCRLVGGAQALRTLERIALLIPVEPTCLEEFLRSWAHFSEPDYESLVLRPYLRRACSFTVHWPEGVSSDGSLGFEGIRDLKVKVFRAQSLEGMRKSTTLRSVEVASAPELTSLSGAEEYPSLRRLWIASAPVISDLESLASSALWDLSLAGAKLLIDPSPLKGPYLRSLDLTGALAVRQWDFLQELGTLRTLRLPRSSFKDLSLLEPMLNLRILDLAGCSVGGMEAIDSLELTALRAPANLAPGMLTRMQPFKRLMVLGAWSVTDLSRIAMRETLRALDVGVLSGGYLGDAFPALESLGCETSDVFRTIRQHGLPVGLKMLGLSSDSLESLEGLEALVDLERLDLRGSPNVSDISALKKLPNLRWLGLEPGQNEILYTMDWPAKASIEVVASEWWSVGQDVG